MRLAMIVATVLCGVWVGACTTTNLSGPDKTQETFQTVTEPVRLVADTQEHEIMGLPASLKGGLFDRTLTEVTIRPPQQALFGRMILADTIRRSPAMPVIHLGDLLDLSCRSELKRMDEVFRLAGSGWVLTPGNHDGLAMGIFNFSSDLEKIAYGSWAWDYECRIPHSGDLVVNHNPGPQGYFASNDIFIDWYLSKKQLPRAKTPKNDALTIPVALPGHSPPKGEPVWRNAAENCSADPADPGEMLHWARSEGKDQKADASNVPAMIQEVYARIEHWSRCYGTLASRSFLLQKIALPGTATAKFKVSMILLDTTQTDQRFDGLGIGLFADMNVANALQDNPGNMGYLLDNQIQALSAMIAAQKDNEIIIFGGHHPWDALSPDSKAKLAAALAGVKNPLVYISAHTHTGYWRRHLADGRNLLELNVSSLADWPIAFRELQVESTSDRKMLRIDAKLNGVSFQATAEGKQPSPSAQLVADWEQHCKDLPVTFDRLRQRHSEIVARHREARQNWAFFIDALIVDRVRNTVADNWDNFVDKLNDMEKGAEALGLAADLDPAFHDRIDQVLERIIKASPPKAPCAANDLQDCIEGAWSTMRHKLETGEVDAYYDQFSGFIAEAQAVIDGTDNDAERRYLACTAVAAALSDDSMQGDRSPDALPLENSVYDSSHVAIW